DPDGNGFYQTGRDAEQLVVRPRELFDNAIPAGSSVAADVLQRLGRLTATPAWEQSGLTALHPVLRLLAPAPPGLGHALRAAPPPPRPRRPGPRPPRLRPCPRRPRLRPLQSPRGGHRRPPPSRRDPNPPAHGVG